jgi:multimeric flavodoxin WrbA
MYSLLKESEREKLISFAEDYFEAIERRRITTRSFYPLLRHDYRYTSSSTVETVDTADKKIVMVTDVTANDGNLAMMIQFIKDTYSGNMEIVDLNKMNFAEGCIGCLSCGFDNRCIFEGADIFNSVFDTKLKNADIIIYAGSIRDRFLSSQWKLFFDRSFFTNHIPSLAGKQMGFVISGPLHQLSNLREILEAYSECMHSHAVDFVTDEDGDPAVIDALLRNLASRLIKYAQNRYIKPFTFLSIGGRKILRDEIWGRLRFIFQADHRFYKKHRMYDYPQKDFTSRFRNIMMITLTKIPPIKRMFVRRIREEMVRPHRKIVDGYFATRRY